MEKISTKASITIAVVGFSMMALGFFLMKYASKEDNSLQTGSTKFDSYQEACKAGDFETAHQFLNTLYDKYMEGYGDADDYQSYRVKEVREKYHAALNYIFKQEMMFCASEGSEQASDKIIYLLTEIPEEGSPHPDGRYSWVKIREDCEDAKEHITYCKWVTNYNSLCTQIINLAISQNNEYLARKVLLMYKQNVVNEKDAYKDNDDYKVKRLWTDKEEAIAKCREAGINIQ